MNDKTVCGKRDCTALRYKRYPWCEAHTKEYYGRVKARRNSTGADAPHVLILDSFCCPSCGVRRVRVNGEAARVCWACGAHDTPPAPRSTKRVVQEAGNTHPTEIITRDDGTMSIHHNKGMLADRFAQIAAEEDEKIHARVERMLKNMLFGDSYTDGTLTVTCQADKWFGSRRLIVLRGDVVLDPQADAAALIRLGWQHAKLAPVTLTEAQVEAAHATTKRTVKRARALVNQEAS